MHGDLSSQLVRRRQAVAERWNLGEQAVLIGAGEPVPVPGRGDRTYPFHAHSEYFYLTDRERPGGVLAFDPGDGWFDFVTPVTRDEALWEGADPSSVDGIDIAELESWLAPRKTKNSVWLGTAAHAASFDPQL